MLKRFVIQLLRAVLLLISMLAGFVFAFSAVAAVMVFSGSVEPGQRMYVDALAPTRTEAIAELLITAAVIAIAMGARRWLESCLQPATVRPPPGND